MCTCRESGDPGGARGGMAAGSAGLFPFSKWKGGYYLFVP